MLALYIIAGIVLFIVLVLSIPVDMALDLEALGRAHCRNEIADLEAEITVYGHGLAGAMDREDAMS